MACSSELTLSLGRIFEVGFAASHPFNPVLFVANRSKSHWFGGALSRPSISILAVTIFVGQAIIVKPLATATFCAPFTV